MSTFDPDAVPTDKLATGYDAWGFALPNYLFTAKAAAGLYSTAEDMGRWLVATIEMYGNLASPVLLSTTLKTVIEPVKSGYGLGMMKNSTPEQDLVIWHSGANAGWRCIYMLLPDRQDGIVVLTNSDQGTGLMYGVLNEWFAWENTSMRFQYRESFGMKLLYFYNILRNVVQ